MWRVDFDPDVAVLSIRLTAHVDATEMRAVAAAHARALEATGRQPFRLLADLRGLLPMEPEAVLMFSDMKRVACSLETCEGIAILADSPTVAMQQHWAQLEQREQTHPEIITLNPDEALRFIGL